VIRDTIDLSGVSLAGVLVLWRGVRKGSFRGKRNPLLILLGDKGVAAWLALASQLQYDCSTNI